MKHFFLLLLLAIFVLGAATARAQDYRPFRFGLSYQLSASATPGDTTHLLRLASRQAQGPDSLFLFDKRTSQGQPQVQQGNCGAYVRRSDNLFGASLRLRPGAEYVLTAANGRTFTLRPRLAVGQPWAATTAGLTASVTARTLGTVLGQADSLATITLSDGAVLVLSKRFGWVSGPPLGRYLSGHQPPAPLTLTALPELGLGTSRLGTFAVYDFQPGDVFLRLGTSVSYTAPGAPCVSQIWTRDSIISRTQMASGDVEYQQQRRTLTRSCYGPPVLGASVVQAVRITQATDQLNQPTNFWALSSTSNPSGLVHLPAWSTAAYNGRLVQQHLLYLQCAAAGDSTSLRDASSLDAGYYLSTAPGLGQTRVQYIGFSTENIVLIGYRKGSETWGQLTTFAQLLPVRDSRPATATAAFPNPFGVALTVAFVLNQPQPVALALRDALGRVVQERAAAPLLAGPQQLLLATAALPVGVYTLHLRFGQDGHTEVLTVLKTQ